MHRQLEISILAPGAIKLTLRGYVIIRESVDSLCRDGEDMPRHTP